MENQNLKELIKQGFAAMKVGSKVAAEATDEIQNDVKNEELKSALKQGNEQSKVWAQRIDRGLEEAGGSADQENETAFPTKKRKPAFHPNRSGTERRALSYRVQSFRKEGVI